MPLPTAPGWVPVFNTTSEAVPAFGVGVFSHERSAYLNGPAGSNDYYTEAFSGQSVVRIKKADSSFLALTERAQSARIWVNGPNPMLPNRLGLGTRQWPAKALVFSDDATLPVPGDYLGIVEDQWYLTVASNTDYLPSSSDPAGPAIARFLCWEGGQPKGLLASQPRIAMIDQVAGPRLLLGKADSTVSVDSSGTFSIYNGTTRTDTGRNVTAYCLTAITNTSIFCFIEEIDGTYYATPAECQ